GTLGSCNTQGVTLQQSGGVPTNRISHVFNTNWAGCDSVGGFGARYDAAGNMSYAGASPCQYDCDSRVAKVSPGQSGEIDYFYDAANRRVKSVGPTTTTYYIWEGGQVIAEYTNGAATGTGLKFYHPDLLSTRMTTGSTGVIGTQDNLPFGDDLDPVGRVSGNVEKHRFTNYERDSDGTDYAINRQYSRGIGRFRQPDPWPGGIGNPQSFNRYAYAMGNPVNLADPSGLFPIIPSNSIFFDASLSGPGLYIDGVRVITEGEYRLFAHLLSSGAAVIAPIGATVRWMNGGYYITVKTGYPPGDDFNPSYVSYPVPDQPFDHQWFIWHIAYVASLLLGNIPEC